MRMICSIPKVCHWYEGCSGIHCHALSHHIHWTQGLKGRKGKTLMWSHYSRDMCTATCGRYLFQIRPILLAVDTQQGQVQVLAGREGGGDKRLLNKEWPQPSILSERKKTQCAMWQQLNAAESAWLMTDPNFVWLASVWMINGLSHWA